MRTVAIAGILIAAAGVVIALLVASHVEQGHKSMERVAGGPVQPMPIDAAPSAHSADRGERSEKVATTENLSAPVKSLLGLDGGKQHYHSLEAAISKLSKELSADDVAALRDLLAWPNEMFPEGMRAIEINAVKNDVLDRLLRQDKLPEGIGLQLVEMASNPEYDPVWRDYCVQFMAPYYERASGESAAKDRMETKANSPVSKGPVKYGLDAVREAMVAALGERGGTIAGTALIGLELLSRTHDEFDREAIVNSALGIAADESASSSCRLTALRLSAGLATQPSPEAAAGRPECVEGAAETARLLAQTGETVLLRSAAIVTLGEIGADDDRELLMSLAADGNKQIADAARLALGKMDAPPVPVVDRSQPTAADDTAAAQPEPKLPPVPIN